VVTTREEGSRSTGAIEKVFREEYAVVFSGLVRVLGDFDEAEDAIAEAFASAIEAWPKTGHPHNRAAWITTAARNAAVSARRRRAVAARKEPEVEHLLSQPADDADDRLRLIFTCCHPALAPEASIPFALRTTCGLSTSAVARLLLVPEATVAQRLVRAKRKIRESGISYAVPDADHLDARVEAVLHVVYLMFTEGYAPAEEELVVNVELCEEAIRLARLLAQLLPTDGETRGLLALMLLHHARRGARSDDRGDIVPLDRQDRSLWDRGAIGEGVRQLDEALHRRGTGPYRIQAAIAALHAQATSPHETDWAQIASLYQELYAREPSAPAAVSWCVALGMALGPGDGLALLERLAREGALAGSDRVHAARADLLRRAGREAEARAAYAAAVAAARSAKERRFLERRASGLARARG